ncbi:hypothetical protein T459_18955 [Capsicum annuum]|uniref:Ubiquitin-like protease family profile domain-containing protein n=1 Tax=Capsicum annuum TaxID=4072 RepID=A0A2G2Z0C5_CAPAN|nr:hypothetical protein T459_18955 [Capsicum annuum]
MDFPNHEGLECPFLSDLSSWLQSKLNPQHPFTPNNHPSSLTTAAQVHDNDSSFDSDLTVIPDRKIVDGIKIELFEATAITRKIILEGGHVIIDDGSGSGSGCGSGSGATVEANDAPFTILKQQGIMIIIMLVIHIFLQILPHLANVLHANVDVTAEATAEEHNITVDNPSTASKEEEKVEPVSLGERNNYPFEGFNISDKAPKKLTKLINNYSEWIFDGLLKHHTGRYCQQQPEVSQNKECLINIIKGFNIPAGLPWHSVDKVYIPINCGDEFHWILAVVILKKRRIRVHDSMLRRRHSSPSSEIQKLAKILATYLNMSGFLDQKVTYRRLKHTKIK